MSDEVSALDRKFEDCDDNKVSESDRKALSKVDRLEVQAVQEAIDGIDEEIDELVKNL